jgi:glycosyltransferase involved in cell wall biosynthesis
VRVAIVTSSPPKTEGGHLVIGRALTRALAEAGHEARLIVTLDNGFGRNISTYWTNWRTNVGIVDQVISLRYPSYAVRHRPHLCWLNHTIREYYDLWPEFSSTLSPLNTIKEKVRRMGLRTADKWLLRHNVDRVMAQSATIERRLAEDFGIRADVVWPPAPQRPYRCDGYGDYVFAVSRLVPLKRIELLVRALAEPPARHVRAVVAGDGAGRSSLEELARSLAVHERIRFTGHITEAELIDHLAQCRAVCFTPLQEDYGFVTVEAFASSKGVITCRDSGGPTELVEDGVTGLMTDPTPASLAFALQRVMDDESLAVRLGAAARARAETLTWPQAVKQLLIV